MKDQSSYSSNVANYEKKNTKIVYSKTQPLKGKITPKKLKFSLSDFKAHQLLGSGSFGDVYLVQENLTHKYYAMKVLLKSKILTSNIKRYALTERNILSTLNHPFLVKLHSAFQTKEKLYLVQDYCAGGDLSEYLSREGKFNEDKARFYTGEIILAIEYLHEKGIIYRDLKPDNIVLDGDGHVRLTDFGLSKVGIRGSDEVTKSFCGSYAYLAPEILNKDGHTMAVDWYLLGVVLFELLTGLPPFYAPSKETLFSNIRTSKLTFPPYVSLIAQDLISKLMHRDPKLRLRERIMEHPFFEGIQWDKMIKKQYMAPEPYLKVRFEEFLRMDNKSNQEVEILFQKDMSREKQFTSIVSKESHHFAGWSFASDSFI
ncbi:hypothetical protein FGO68_gene7813 [Halteria grandinella]|uniref:Protein kinase domain-containing protein n=1 Tax=Halteria grandinella TaxID=5974 RepID=A0A8J8NZ27_HALGN|nr:hypothetical protein FGO68_gene7813 [Halteria grandinella]